MGCFIFWRVLGNFRGTSRFLRWAKCVLQELKDFKFDWRYMMRGLTIDKKRGNILKIDRHKYVKLAYHGFKKLNRAERLAVYNTVMLPKII